MNWLKALPHRVLRVVAATSVCTTMAFIGASSSGAVSVGSPPGGGGGFTWGVGVGGSCNDVVAKIRRNWMDVRTVIAPDSKLMRPRSRDFFCVSPAYIQDALPKVVPMSTGLRCFDVQGKGFCCDQQYQQCATM